MNRSPISRFSRPRSVLLLGTTLLPAAALACGGGDDATGPSGGPRRVPMRR
jgi:hypothetical protein